RCSLPRRFPKSIWIDCARCDCSVVRNLTFRGSLSRAISIETRETNLYRGVGMKTETIEYKDGDVTLRGYLAYDETKSGKRPGILVMPEALGLGEHAK